MLINKTDKIPIRQTDGRTLGQTHSHKVCLLRLSIDRAYRHLKFLLLFYIISYNFKVARTFFSLYSHKHFKKQKCLL